MELNQINQIDSCHLAEQTALPSYITCIRKNELVWFAKVEIPRVAPLQCWDSLVVLGGLGSYPFKIIQ